MPILWIIVISAGAILAALILIITLRTALFKPITATFSHCYSERADMSGPEKLSEAVRVKTLSYMELEKTDRAAFTAFHTLLEKLFPLVHARCERTIINDLSIVYSLRSDSPKPGVLPVLITAHMDVVPVEEGTENVWTEPPYSGKIADGLVWGRGTLDTKAHIIGVMEALERLISKGLTPARDIWLAFGHDEELNGQNGALKIAEYFKNLGIEFEFVLDEGGCAAKNVMTGVDAPIALVGVVEKGYANLRLSVTCDGGHSSMPAPNTSLGILAQALCRVENHPIKPRLIGPTRDFLMRVGPYMKGINKAILANLWLFKPLFLRVFGQTKRGSALVRTTAAVTMAQGSPAPNVVPQKSSAVVNCRILPGESGETLLLHFRKILKGLPVDIEPIDLDDPSALSSTDSDAFKLIESLIGEFCPGSIIAPYPVLAGTDARKYECVSKNVYRFTPYVIDNDDLDKIHGTNENISVANVNRCIDFFTALMERL